MRKEIQEKLNSAKGFLKVCQIISNISPLEKDKKEEFLDNDKLPFSIVCRFLYSVIFELTIKALYELDTNNSCPKTHELEKLYNDLNNKTQSSIKTAYNNLKKKVEEVAEVAEVAERANQQKNINISYNTFEEVLKHNKEIITNFKYEPKFNQNMNSAFSNVIVVPEESISLIIPFPIYSSFFNDLFELIKQKI